MRKERVGFAVCGSFCTHQQVLGELEKLVQLYETVIPITSENTAFTDTRFGTSDDLLERLEDLTGHEVLCDIPSVEPIGPKGLLDVLVVAPATGNTIAKLERNAGCLSRHSYYIGKRCHKRHCNCRLA